ncbi:hypothetical protein HU200_054086 [Digitaria exilis]|uniref:FBD domain-containing protein n=1 Tax=Digitaria exilis TaxID=1010633 RepID=A0A835E4L8_9POAL|nr:hypothetical protein HU200_054086 [Digitaria exilis]
MKLKLDFDTSHVAVAEKDDAFFSNNMFCNLERLELEVPSEAATATGSKTPALLIANLLHCCPVVRDLHVKVMTKRLKTSARQIKHRSDFNKAINHFRNHRKSPEIFLNGENDGGNENYKVSDIPGLSDRTFNCLKSNLRAVGLQFWMDEPNCFGPQLAKFFVENAAVLEEISIDDGNHKMHEHMNHMIKRWWIHSSSKRKNSPITTAFRDCDARKRQTREADNS